MVPLRASCVRGRASLPFVTDTSVTSPESIISYSTSHIPHPTSHIPHPLWFCSPKGTWNSEAGQDNCNACPPGKFSSTLGSKECKVGALPKLSIAL